MKIKKEITKAAFQKWYFHKATSRQVKFVNTYLKTLNAKAAYQAAGYNYGAGNHGVWKVYFKCFPYIQYKLKQTSTAISKEFIISKWLEMLQTGDNKSKADALKQLSKLFNYSQAETQVNIQNNMPETPITINFTNDEKDSD